MKLVILCFHKRFFWRITFFWQWPSRIRDHRAKTGRSTCPGCIGPAQLENQHGTTGGWGFPRWNWKSGRGCSATGRSLPWRALECRPFRGISRHSQEWASEIFHCLDFLHFFVNIIWVKPKSFVKYLFKKLFTWKNTKKVQNIQIFKPMFTYKILWSKGRNV